MRTIALMVTRNEAHRYLQAVLDWTRPIVDEMVVFDDGSTDDTCRIALDAGATVGFRGDDVPRFTENESAFRQAAWSFVGEFLHPTTDDFVVCLDADEFLLTINHVTARAGLEDAIKQAEAESCDVIDVPVAEVFEYDERSARPMVRDDGQWGKIRAARIARWQRRPVFRDAKLAGGSLPQIAGPPLRLGDPVILHAGYRRWSDRLDKHTRYSSVKGHSSRHVDSILQPGIYTPWPHPLPPLIAEALKEDR